MESAPLSSERAWGATVDSLRAGHEVEFSGRSNVSMKGTRTVRFWIIYTLRTCCSGPGEGYQPLTLRALSSRKAGLAWSTSGGSVGHAGGPPTFSFNAPEI